VQQEGGRGGGEAGAQGGLFFGEPESTRGGGQE